MFIEFQAEKDHLLWIIDFINQYHGVLNLERHDQYSIQPLKGRKDTRSTQNLTLNKY